MSRFLSLVVGALLLLWLVPTPIQATDGDGCGLTDWATSHGRIRPIWCVLICDGKSSQDSDCTELDLQDIGATGHGAGIPDVVAFEINTSTGCTANATATFASTPTTGGTEHDLGSTTSVSLDGNTKLTIDLSQVSIDRYIETDLTNMDNCTDFDVLMIGYERWSQ